MVCNYLKANNQEGPLQSAPVIYNAGRAPKGKSLQQVLSPSLSA